MCVLHYIVCTAQYCIGYVLFFLIFFSQVLSLSHEVSFMKKSITSKILNITLLVLKQMHRYLYMYIYIFFLINHINIFSTDDIIFLYRVPLLFQLCIFGFSLLRVQYVLRDGLALNINENLVSL